MNQLALRVRRGDWPNDIALPESFAFDDDPELADQPSPLELVVAVDGEAVLYRWGGMGLEPDDVLNPDLPWLPADGEHVRRVLQRCGCGVIGCGAVTGVIERDGSTIRWYDIRADGRPFELGPFTFDAIAYEAELRRAHARRPWERPDETVARLVAESFRHLRGARPRSFDWASASGDGHVIVSMTRWRRNPLAGHADDPRHDDGEGGWWQGVHPDELFEQHLGTFAIPEGVGAADAATVIASAAARDPGTWPPYGHRW